MGRAACAWRRGVDPLRTAGSCDGLGHIFGVAEQSLAGAGRSSALRVQPGEVALARGCGRRSTVHGVGQAARQRGGRGERATEAVKIGAAGLYAAADDDVPHRSSGMLSMRGRSRAAA